MDLDKILLHLACSGNLEYVKECLQNGANIEVKDDNGRTALILNVWSNCLDIENIW